MRLGAQLVGDLRKMLAEELRAGERAAMTAIRTEIVRRRVVSIRARKALEA
jgi:hypothetical protein